jgi:hypothetical protein
MYKYLGGGFIVGIPARDISKTEFDALNKTVQDVIKDCGLYKLIKTAAKNGEE